MQPSARDGAWAGDASQKVEELLQRTTKDDPQKLTRVRAALQANSKHYHMLVKLVGNPAAALAYLQLLDPPVVKSSGRRPAAEEEVQDPLDAAREESLRKDYRAMLGTELVVFDGWTFLAPETKKRVTEVATISTGAAAATWAHFAISAKSAAATAAAAAQGSTLAAKAVASAGMTVQLLGRAAGQVGAADAGASFQAAAARLAELSGQQQLQHLQRAAQDLAQTSRAAGRVSTVLTVGFLGYGLYDNVRRYWKGEIDGHQVCENVLATVVATSAGCVAGLGAATLCAGAGPAGILLVSLMGAGLVAGAAEMAVRSALTSFFGTRRDRALRQSYSTLGLGPTSSPEQIRKRYLELALQQHPDKPGGDKAEFIRTNCAYELIRASRLSD